MPRKTTGLVLLLIATSGCAGPPWLARRPLTSSGPKAITPPIRDQAAAEAAPGFLPSSHANPASPVNGFTPPPQHLHHQQLANHLLPGSESPRQQFASQSPDGQHPTAPRVAAIPGSYPTPYTSVYDQPAATLPPQIQQYVDQTVAVAVQRQNSASAPPASGLNESPADANPPGTAPAELQRDAAFNINDADETAEVALASTPVEPAAEPDQTPPADLPVQPQDIPVAAASGIAGQVIQASHTTQNLPESAPGQWRDEAARALASLEKELSSGDFSASERARLNANARLLHAILNDPNQALRPIEEFDADEREYWKHLTLGLITSLDADEKHTSSRRSALALQSIRLAADHLANISTLDVRNVAFCSKVESYGRFDEFKAYGFQPGQEVLLYVEVQNFAVASTGDRHETELQGEYTIFDAAGQRVANTVLPLDKQASKNRRHDYFIAYRVFMPKTIEQGHYTLQLTIEDVKGSKSNQASVEFWIR